MKKNKLFLYVIVWLSSCFFPFLSKAQSNQEISLGSYQNFLSEFTAAVNAKAEEQTVMLKGIDQNLKGVLNFSKSENRESTFIGFIQNYPESNLYIHFKQDGTVEGHILLSNTSTVAYQYYSAKDGSVKLKEVSPHDIICIGLKGEETPAKSTQVTAPPAGSPAYQLQGLPGAPNVIYLDFDGEYVSGTPWNNGNPINAAPSVFNEAQVIQIFEGIREDFRPYNVNITTDVTVYNNTPTNRKGRCIFTPTNTAAPGSGGVAYLNSFGSSNRNPCWVFLGTTSGGLGAGSHEIGHTLGLSHDRAPGQEYYSGHGIWSPIMGCATCKSFAQWSKGEYNGALNTQDDLAIMATKIPYRTDDHANTTAGATVLKINAGNVSADANNGVITTRTDVDFFSFTTTGGNIILNIQPIPNYPDLDILAMLYNSSGTVIGTYDPKGSVFSASINATLAAGTYYVSVDGTGQDDPATNGYSDYASLGYFSISGTIPSSGGGNVPPVVAITSPANGTNFTAPATITITANASDTDGTISKVEFFNGNTKLGEDLTAPYSFTWTNVTSGTYSLTASATDDGGLTTTSAVVTITVGSTPSAVDITNLTGTVTAQYYDSPAGEDIAKLIDNSATTKYLTFHNSGWVQFQSASGSYVVTRYAITSANDAAQRDPLTWTLQGSTNGSTWSTLDSRTNQDFPNRFQRREFTFSNTITYSYYRLQMTNNSGTILQLAEWEIYGTASGSASIAENLSIPTFKPYPNPARDLVNVIAVSTEFHTVQLIDDQGNIVKSWENVQGPVSISDLKPGAYWVRILGREDSGVQKLIIE
jgi:hypothetical protein